MPGIDKKELKKLIGHESPNIIEIGAYDGRDTRELRDLFECPTILAFEADPVIAANFFFDLSRKDNKPLNKNINFWGFAVGAQDQPASFLTSDNHRQSGSVCIPKEHCKVWPEIVFDELSLVPQYRLDTLAAHPFWPFRVEPDNLDETDDIDLIWADVNGAELQVIEGARETLQKTKFLYIEFGVKELYEGQGNLAQIQQALPGFWVLLNAYDVGKNFGNALFENKELS